MALRVGATGCIIHEGLGELLPAPQDLPLPSRPTVFYLHAVTENKEQEKTPRLLPERFIKKAISSKQLV